ncbi:hypothetical protein [Streptomyces sp. VRA16 Mangrove soil]|uniref:hypothetical protein n=1 Tax=Streptomyces sp. VRA16 Mangrove soil TaxID=2817434 RepID=UPI001A9DD4A2|nr:hypothetical protein [Streptomyces sp. VRA16 Mangrove soil]MBO1332554.1 hypothetical protein [Streptomyces sp. VRA16 Mangrove soil]
MPAFTELPATVATELGDRLKNATEDQEMMTVTADSAQLAEHAVRSLLADGAADLIHVTVRAPANRTAVIGALHAALLPSPGRRPRPRILSEAEGAIDAALDRRTRPVLMVGDAQQLRSDGLQCLYGTWRAATDRHRPFPLILTGTARLSAVLKRPVLDSVNSRICYRYQIRELGD